MGIEDYWSFIADVFPEVLQRHSRFKSHAVDHVMVDLNHALYHCAGSGTDEEVVETTLDYLDNMLALFPARKSIFVALDGPGSFLGDKLDSSFPNAFSYPQLCFKSVMAHFKHGHAAHFRCADSGAF